MKHGVCLLLALSSLEQSNPGGIRSRKHFSYLTKLGWSVYALCRDHTKKDSFSIKLITPQDFQDFATKFDESITPGQCNFDSPVLAPMEWSCVSDRLRNWIRGFRPRRFIPFTDGWSFQIPDEEIYRQAKEINPDVIVSTSPPVYTHVVASMLAQRLGTPWVAELRDFWSDNWFNRKIGFLHHLDREKEKKALRHARALVTVTPQMADVLGRRHHKEVQVVFPSYWAGNEDLSGNWPTFPPMPLKLLFTGRFYYPGNTPKALLTAILNLLKSKEITAKEIRLEIYSPNPAQLKRYLEASFGRESNDIMNICRVHQPVPHEKVKPLLESHHLLLAMGVDVPGNEGVITSKLPEYLGCRPPILATGSPDSYMMHVIKETGTGYVGATVEQCEAILRKAVELARRGKMLARPNPDFAAISEFTSKRQAERLGALLTRVLTHQDAG